MNVALQRDWTGDEFFAWAERQPGRYEFDGRRPVAMTGGTVNHGLFLRNLHRALGTGLRGSACRALGPDVGVTTISDATRYPDALVTCARLNGAARTVLGVVVIFEIISPSSGRNDRMVKRQVRKNVLF
jgi:Uma2 family endonuclease